MKMELNTNLKNIMDDVASDMIGMMRPAKMPEQRKELEAMQLRDADKEQETALTDSMETLSEPEPIQELEYHEYANIFPMLSGENFNDFVESIRQNGLDEKIVLLGGKILDGRNRHKALLVLGMFDSALHCVEYEGDDPLGLVIRKNLHRRHLDESQRAMVAVKIANLQHGGDRKNQTANLPFEKTAPITQAKAADMINVGERSVRDAKVVLNSGDNEVIEGVASGKIAVSTAAKQVRATRKKVVRKKSVKANSTQSESGDAAQPHEQVPADFMPGEWMQAAKNAWWRIPVRGQHARQNEMSEIITEATKCVQRAVKTDMLNALLAGLQDVKASVKAGGSELIAVQINTVFAAKEVLKGIVHALSRYPLEELQTWSNIQKRKNGWTPFDDLPSYRKRKLHVDDSIYYENC